MGAGRIQTSNERDVTMKLQLTRSQIDRLESTVNVSQIGGLIWLSEAERDSVYKMRKQYQTHQMNERRASHLVSEKIAKSHFGRNK